MTAQEEMRQRLAADDAWWCRIKEQAPFVNDDRLQIPADNASGGFATRLGVTAFLQKKRKGAVPGDSSQEAVAAAARGEQTAAALLAQRAKVVAAESALTACLLVYCSPLPAKKRETLLDRVWKEAVRHGLLGGTDAAAPAGARGSKQAGAADSSGAAAPPTRMEVAFLINELVCTQWQRVVGDADSLLPCQILTFASGVPLLLDHSGTGVRWLRSMSHLWVSSGGPAGLTGRPRSELIPAEDAAAHDDKSHVPAGNNSKFHARTIECCEGSISNFPKALAMLKLAAQEGLVAILHDVADISALRLVPSGLLLPASQRPSTDAPHSYYHRTGASRSVLEPGCNTKLKQTHCASQIIVSLDNDESTINVDQNFRLVLVCDAVKPKPELMSVTHINVINFNLTEAAVHNILLHHVVSIENPSLHEELERCALRRANTALSLDAVEQQLLAFLSSSEGALLTDGSEMSKLNHLRKRQDKVKQDAARDSDALEADERSVRQYHAIAASAVQVSCALAHLLEDFEDQSFRVGIPVLQGLLAQSLQSSSDQKTTTPNRLAQAAADVRLDLHRTISLGLESHNRRLFTVQLALTCMQKSGMLTREEAVLLTAICTHRKEPVQAARKALEEARKEAEEMKQRFAASSPPRTPSQGGTNLSTEKTNKTPQGGGAGKDRSASASTARAQTATPSERPRGAHTLVLPATSHGARGGHCSGLQVDLTDQVTQLRARCLPISLPSPPLLWL